MVLNYITVTLDLYDGAGAQEHQGGYQFFAPSTTLTNTTDHQLITQKAIISPQLNGSGPLPTVSLLATDNANVSPSGWTWLTFFGTNPAVQGAPAPFNFFLPAGPAAFTATNASPCVFTWTPTAALTALPNGTGIQLTGSPPTGFSTSTTYYVVNSSGTTFNLAATVGGSAINSSSTGSGNLTVVSMFLSNLIQMQTAPASYKFWPALKANVTVTSSGALTANQVTECNAFSSALTMTLPNLETGSIIVVEKLDSLANTVTISGNMRGTPGSTIALVMQYEQVLLYAYQGSWWPMAGGNTFTTLDARYIRVVTPQQFGGKGDGVNDDTAAIQAAINFITGNANPVTTARSATAILYFPPGTYKVTSDLNIVSTHGFNLRGAGADVTLIKATSGGTFTHGVLYLNGWTNGLCSDFSIVGNGTESLPNAIDVEWDNTTAASSTSGSVLRNIQIYNSTHVTGVNLGGNSGNRQVDSIECDNVRLTGNQFSGTWSGAGNWANGVLIGSGVNGNNYNQVLTRCDASGYNIGMFCNASSFALRGSQPAFNGTDFKVVASAQCSIQDVQSQNSGVFLQVGPTSAISSGLSVRDVMFGTNLDTTANWIQVLGAGSSETLVFENVANSFMVNHPSPVITLNNSGGGSPGFSVTMLHVRQANSLSSGISGGGNPGNVTVIDYMDTSTSPRTITPFAVVTFAGGAGGIAIPAGPTGATQPSRYMGATSSGAPASGTFQTGDFVLDRGANTFQVCLAGGSPGTWQQVSRSPDVQWFTSSGTWAKPTGAKTVRVQLLAGGAGGGSGALTASGQAGGGGGGGCGGFTLAEFAASDLTNTISVTVGAGGNGASAVVSAGNGAAGSAGGVSLFGAYCWANTGLGGGGGTSAAGGGAGVSGVGSVTLAGGTGNNASAGNATTTAANTNNAQVAGSGAGGAGTTGAAASNGGTSLVPALGTSSGAAAGAGGVAGGASPNGGTAPAIKGQGGPGGGGGASAFGAASTAQTGASANANSGGGGGGGGGCLAGSSSGGGGTGGSGWCLVTTYF